jgi:hypothetical protein
VSDLFERDISKLVSEINGNSKLKKLLGAEKELKADEIYKLQSICHRLSPPFLREVPSVHMGIKCFTHANFK